MIYFDNGATTCPKPISVCTAMEKAVKYYCANPGRSGHNMSAAAQNIIFDMRTKAASLFGVQNPERVILTKNCTEALNIAIKGTLHGGHAICSAVEHNSVIRPLEQLKNQGIIEYDTAAVYPDDEKTIRAFASLIRSDTRLIVCTHVSNAFGIRLPVEQLAALAKSKGIPFVLDAAQSAGAYEINMSDGYSAVCMPGHKGLYGPTGTGLLLLSEDFNPQPLMTGGTGSYSHERQQPLIMPDALESGTLNVPGAAGLSAGISFVKSKGEGAILRHERKITQIIENELSHMKNVITFGGAYGDKSLLSFNIYSVPGEETALLLNNEGIAVRAGYHCAYGAHVYFGTDTGGTVRISPGAFNTEAEAEYLIKKIYKTAK